MFWRYWSASTISNAGDAVTLVALPLTAVIVLHASSLEVSLLVAASYVAWVVIGLPAGVIVHRLPLRETQVAMDLVRAAALLSIPVAAALNALTLAQLVVVALVVSLASVVFDVGNSTFLTSIVSKEELTSRNSLTSASVATTQLGGPSLGGVLVALVGATTSLLVDVVSYLVSAFLLHGLPRPAVVRTHTTASVTTLIRDGWRFVVRHPVMRPCMLDATAINFVCGGLLTLTPLFLVRTLGTPVGLVGLLIATDGVGSLIGAALTPRLVRTFGSARAMVIAGIVAAAFLAALPLSFAGWGLVLFGVGNAGFAGGVVVTSIVARTHRQQVAPPELLPRVMATVRFVSWGVIPVGALVAGVLAQEFGVRSALIVLCLSGLAIPLIVLSTPIRHLRSLDDSVPSTAADVR